MSATTPAPAGFYCAQCSYDLRGLSSRRCPECGRPFDPENRRTFRQTPRPSRLKELLQRAAALLTEEIDGQDGSDWRRRLKLVQARSAAASVNVMKLRRRIQVLEGQIDQLIERMIAQSLLTPADAEQIREEIERAAQEPLEIEAEDEPPVFKPPDDAEACSQELLALSRAVEEAQRRTGR